MNFYDQLVNTINNELKQNSGIHTIVLYDHEIKQLIHALECKIHDLYVICSTKLPLIHDYLIIIKNLKFLNQFTINGVTISYKGIYTPHFNLRL